MAVIHTLYSADCEPRLYFVNWYLQGTFAAHSDPTHILFNCEAWFSLIWYVYSQNRYWSA